MAQHSEFGFSHAYRWLGCPGSVAACRNRESKSGAYAQEGSDAHALAEYALMMDCSAEEAAKGQDIPDDYIEAVQIYLNFCRSLGGQIFTELHVDLGPILDPHMPPVFSTLDFVSIAETVHIVDFKGGAGIPVYVKDNPQCLGYAAGALLFCREKFPAKRIAKVATTIIQPRCHAVPDEQTEVYEVNDIWAWTKNVCLPGIRKALSKNPPRIAGEKQCQFCSFSAECPERREHALKMAGMDFSPVLQGQLPAEKQTALSVEQIANIIQKSGDLKQWLKVVYGLALEQAQNGIKFPGLKLVRTSKNRAWKPGAEAALVKLVGDREAYTRKILSPKVALSLLKTLQVGKEERAKIESFIEKPLGELCLVPDDDPREEAAIVPTNVLDFNEDLFA